MLLIIYFSKAGAGFIFRFIRELYTKPAFRAIFHNK